MRTASQRKIIFIEPKAPDLHIFSVFVIPRLGNMILGAIMKELGWDAEVIVEENEPIDFEQIRNADMVGISTITSTAPRAYTIADHVKAMGIPVIMGGPHVSFLPEEALQHADFVIRGEGEKALPLFIERWLDGQDLSGVPNLSYKKGDVCMHNPEGERIKDLDSIPFPDLSLIKNGIRSTFGYRVIPIQTSRGCPFNCEFCSVTCMFGKKVRYRSTGNIIRELHAYNHRKNVLFFCDDNFTANIPRAKELLEAMIREKFVFKWSTQVRADMARDPELVKLMYRAGCRTVFIGFESIDPENLKAMQKQQSLEEIKRSIRTIASNRIHIHAMFVFGFENDNKALIKKTIHFANTNPIATCQFLILTPLPGTITFQKMNQEGRIKFFDWSLYDAHHPVFIPRNLTFHELQKAQIKAHQSFYSLGKLVLRFLAFKWDMVSIGFYARRLNRLWKKRNILWLKVLKLLKPNFNFKISIDFRQIINLNRERSLKVKVPLSHL